MRKTISAAVMAVAVASAMVPAAAYAGSAKISDNKGDVYTIEWNPKTEKDEFKKSKQKVNVDVKKMVVKHTAKRIELTTTYYALDKKAPEPTSGITVKTDDGSEFSMYGGAYKGPDGWTAGGSVYEPTAQHGRLPAFRGQAECQGVKAHADFKKNTFTVSAPRTCFRDPKWIKAHGEAVAFKYTEKSYVTYFDNAHTKKGNMKGWTDKIKKG